MIKSLKYLFIFTISISPYIFLRAFSFNLTFFDISLILFSLIYLFKQKPKKIIKNIFIDIDSKLKIYYFLAIPFVLLSFFALINQIAIKESFFGTLQITFILLFMIPILYYVLDMELYKKCIDFLIYGWQIFIIINLFILSNEAFYHGGRFASFYGLPVDFSPLAAVFIILLIYKFRKEKNIYLKISTALFIVANMYLLNLSGSRGSFLAMLLGIVIYFIILNSFSLQFFKNILIIIIALSLVNFMPLIANKVETFIDDMNDIEDVNVRTQRNVFNRVVSVNDNGRIRDYKAAFKLIPNVFFLGYGIDTSDIVVAKYGGRHRPHNLFLSIWLEVGFIGFILSLGIFWLMLGWGLKLIYERVIKKREVNELIAATYCSGLILFISNQVSTASVHRGYWIFWGFCLWISTKKEYYYKTN
ncbi:MAG: O-antigen ligase family protein [Bacillota bacterium]